MNGLLKADLAELKAAHLKLEGRMGTYRLKAAHAALAAETVAPSSSAPHPPANVSRATARAPGGIAALAADDGSDVIALARQVGLAGFTTAPAKEGSHVPPTIARAAATGPADDLSDTIALARAVGLHGFEPPKRGGAA